MTSGTACHADSQLFEFGKLFGIYDFPPRRIARLAQDSRLLRCRDRVGIENQYA